VTFRSVCNGLGTAPEGFKGGDMDLDAFGAGDEGNGDCKDNLRLAKFAGTREQDSDRAWFGSHA
jgi:hypothetical protein